MLKLIRTARNETASTPPEKIGAWLVAKDLLTADQLRIALEEQRQKPELLGEICVRLGFLDEMHLADVLGARTDLPVLDSHALHPNPDLLQQWPITLADQHCALPFARVGNTLHLAVADPYDILAGDAAQRHFPECTSLKLFVAPASAIRRVIASYYGAQDGLDKILAELMAPQPTVSTATHPIIRLVDQLLYDAVQRGASDIHLEPEGNFIRIRYRVDGLLQQVRALHLNLWSPLSHRIKIMAGMNIAETRRIQDGRFQQHIAESMIDFRVALMPTVQGENIVIRVLDHKKSLVSLGELGFDGIALTQLRQMAARPQGLTLVTGPTGSGKTTTLYALLREISDLTVKVATLEEPVEYQLEMIRQTAVNDVQGLNFATGVRGVLRVDPDIILIGEIRDAETAQMALRAAITGHKVFSTLHSHDSLSAIARLLDLGLSPGLLAGNITGIVSQRLVGKLCPHCREPYQADAATKANLGYTETADLVLHDAKGCASCHDSGIAGRTIIAEILPIDETLDNMISDGVGRSGLRQHLATLDHRSLKSHGIERVMAGEISLRALRRAVTV